MIGRIVEVADDRRHLFMHRGFMVVQDTEGDRKELGQVPLDDIAAVIANAHGLSYTNNLLAALAERGAPFVLCAANHNAVGMLLPIEGNFEQSHRIEAQIAASQPTHKRLWAAVVRSKLEQQAAALEAAGMPTAPLTALAAKVKSGDPENMEAQGARRYWTLLFGTDFRRDQNAPGTNALLNYGYTVLRAATARAVIAAGLHPSIGLHHRRPPVFSSTGLWSPGVNLTVFALAFGHRPQGSIRPGTSWAALRCIPVARLPRSPWRAPCW